jgi:tRNA pseudouridine38-40 synthase
LRYFIELAYNGKAYHGWQNQPGVVSVQETLEKALFTLLRVKTPVIGAGRTDAGVHASQFFVHFDTEEIAEIDILLYKLNCVLPSDVVVFDLFKVKDDAHARFDAVSRSYEYNVIQQKNPFDHDTAYFVKNKLDLEKMNLAASFLIGYTDFKCFSKSKTDVQTYNCNIVSAFWKKRENKLVFRITANRFLRNMVRAIVGTLLEIGLGKIPEERFHEIIKSRDRKNAGISVPAKGLFLTKIEYPTSIVNK